MYNLVSCYDTVEMKTRGDVLSDKVYLSDGGEHDGLRISQSESILTDMTQVISPLVGDNTWSQARSPTSAQSLSPAPLLHPGTNCNGVLGAKQNGKAGGRHVSYCAAEPEEFRIPSAAPGPASSSYGDKSWSSQRDHNFSKDPESEPYCFPVFRWSLILVGLVMLICVFVVLVQLLFDWGTSPS